MDVTVTGPAGDDTELHLEGDRPSYGDVLDALELSPQEAAVLVDGRPVPADAPVGSETVSVVRLVAGG